MCRHDSIPANAPLPRSRRRLITLALMYVILLAMSLAVGTLWHEGVGHGLTGVLAGGRIESMKVLGVDLWPTVGWSGFVDKRYGSIQITGIPTQRRDHLMTLGGSLSTWAVAVAAVVLLWARRWRGLPRAVLVCLSLWWIDLLTYTLPTWGLRRSIFWGQVYSEPYEAATALGIPGPAFQAFAVGTSAALAAALVVRLVRDRGVRPDR